MSFHRAPPLKLPKSLQIVNLRYMASFRKDLPLIKNLIAFEAASRLDNFTRAAEEMGLTRVAVSRQIADLEMNLGQKLFVRNHRNVTLTAAGEALALAIDPALRAISEALAKQRRGPAAKRLSVTVTTAFATYWLMPRLASFGSKFPDLGINVVVSDHYLDLASEDIDIAIRYMPVPASGMDWRPLMQEEIFPVYSPKYDARTAMSAPQDLLAECLLLLSGSYRAEARWDNWFRSQGLKVPAERSGIQVNTYSNMVQAAIEGQGVALAGYPLVNAHLENGSLLRIPGIRPLKREYYYVLNRNPDRGDADQFCKWLFDEAGREKRD
ncbi:LysR substrate-binding domain-containing protein [Sinorhizobium sp. CB9]